MGKIIHIAIAPKARAPMQLVHRVQAITGCGLEGDRYCTGEGSYNRGKQGKRQVTFFNHRFIANSGFQFLDTLRNIAVENVELNYLIGRIFSTERGVVFGGLKYCEPCNIPSDRCGKPGFKEVFQDLGGLIAEIIEGGPLEVGDRIIVPDKGYK